MDTGIHKIHLFHASDLHFHFSTNTKARWWILKSTKQVKCWIRCIYHCTKHQPQQREGVLFKAILYILYINNTKWIQTKMTVKYSLYWKLDNCNNEDFIRYRIISIIVKVLPSKMLFSFRAGAIAPAIPNFRLWI